MSEDGAVWGHVHSDMSNHVAITVRLCSCKTLLNAFKLIGDSQMVQHALLCIADTGGTTDCVNCTTQNSVTKRQ